MSDGIDLVHMIQELARDLAAIPHLPELYRRAVKGVLSLGFDRAALFLYDPASSLLTGTWGTDEAGQMVNEAHYQVFVGTGRPYLKDALTDPGHIHVWENKILTQEDEAVGFGWNAVVFLQDSDRVFGMITVDNLINQQPLSEMQKEVLTLYGRTVSNLILSRQLSELSEKYKSQNELKDRLFTILAHDLRGPIGNLSVMLGFACDQPMEHKDLMEVLGESRQASQRTYDLLENVLGWVRGQIEEVAALRERLPIRRALVSVQVWLEATAKAKGIHLHIECPENLSVIGDERMVETIVRNLVSNAMKYSPKGGTVVLQGRADGTHVLIEIIDQGTGMPPEKLEGLFLSQQKKSQPGTAGEGGSGLGLMFSSDLAKTLGGRLEAESVLGKGSTFRIVLPDEVDGEL